MIRRRRCFLGSWDWNPQKGSCSICFKLIKTKLAAFFFKEKQMLGRVILCLGLHSLLLGMMCYPCRWTFQLEDSTAGIVLLLAGFPGGSVYFSSHVLFPPEIRARGTGHVLACSWDTAYSTPGFSTVPCFLTLDLHFRSRIYSLSFLKETEQVTFVCILGPSCGTAQTSFSEGNLPARSTIRS